MKEPSHQITVLSEPRRQIGHRIAQQCAGAWRYESAPLDRIDRPRNLCCAGIMTTKMGRADMKRIGAISEAGIHCLGATVGGQTQTAAHTVPVSLVPTSLVYGWPDPEGPSRSPRLSHALLLRDRLLPTHTAPGEPQIVAHRAAASSAGSLFRDEIIATERDMQMTRIGNSSDGCIDCLVAPAGGQTQKLPNLVPMSLVPSSLLYGKGKTLDGATTGKTNPWYALRASFTKLNKLSTKTYDFTIHEPHRAFVQGDMCPYESR